MERLTERHKFELRSLDDKTYNINTIVLKSTGAPAENNEIGKVYNKLCEFEDFMEEQGFESLEIVKKQCDLSVDVLAMDSENSELKIANEKLWQENQDLKDRWEKLKEILIKSRDINKDNINCTTLIGLLGAEAFSELLLREMEELEKGGN